MPKKLAESAARLPISRSAAICQALVNAGRDNTLIVKALQSRLGMPSDANDTVIKYTRDIGLNEVVDDLADRTGLSKEHVIRLAFEAYMHNL